MIRQKVTEFTEVANYTNISNVFKSEYLLSAFGDLSSYQRDILTGISVITMLGILFTNVTVITCLFKTNQTNNLSFRTILHLSFSDVLLALVGVPTFIFGSIMNANSLVLKVASPCITALFVHFSMYIIGLLGVDRFVRINYYTKHRDILTPFRVFMAQIFTWALAVLNTVLIVLDIINQTVFYQIFAVLCDVSLVILVAVLQIKTISSIKILLLTESSLNRKIRKLATKILIAITLLLPPSIVCAIVRGKIEHRLTDEEKGNLQFIFGITVNLLYVNSSTNAVLFLASNVKSKKYLISFLKGNGGSSVKPEFRETKTKVETLVETGLRY